MTSNTFNSLKPNMKEAYSSDNKKFKRIRNMWGKRGLKATAQLDASKNPMKFIQENREPSIKGKKGIAF